MNKSSNENKIFKVNKGPKANKSFTSSNINNLGKGKKPNSNQIKVDKNKKVDITKKK